jgi:parvulin-like peptidyl-prolyl isomerase
MMFTGIILPMTRTHFKRDLALLILSALLFLSACGPDPLTATPAPIPETPTATSIPPALTVNGEAITQAEFEAEVARYQAAQASLGYTPTMEESTRVILEETIRQVLLAQGAAEAGFVLDEATLQERMDALAAQAGGAEALAAWMAANGYTQEGFRLALGRAIAAAWMRDRVIATVPSTAEQVHARQILFYNLNDAQEALDILDSGYDFDDLAARYDPAAKGELGWFPRGYLPESAIEEAAFALQPGEYSGIVETSVGYHILKVIERDASHTLSPDAYLAMQNLALENWLQERRAQSTIILAP